MKPKLSIEDICKKARGASYQMSLLSAEQKNKILLSFASLLEAHQSAILQANEQDVESAAEDLSFALRARLGLSPSKFRQVVQGVRDVVGLADPVGHSLFVRELDKDLILEKVSVPLGVIAIIFESRPDVMPQVISLAIKSGNVLILKGGKEAQHSHKAFMSICEDLKKKHPELPKDFVYLVSTREEVHELLKYPQWVDLVIPRGSNQLVQSIQNATKIPVLGHADGICHMYIHSEAHQEMALQLIIDSKAQYPVACNAIETLLIDRQIFSEFFPLVQKEAKSKNVELIEKPSSWSVEYGDLRLAIKVVENVKEAIAHINSYGSHHTDVVVTENKSVQNLFLNEVDSANVMANASSRFADGFRYGFGAEVGISTNKTHARGPVGLEGLVSYKYLVKGRGHLVKDYTGDHPRPFTHKDLSSEKA